MLYLLRRIPAAHRQFWQFAVLALAVIAAVIVWMLRSPIVALLNASGDLNYRLNLWQKVWAALPAHGVEGWGWVGQWNTDVSAVRAVRHRKARARLPRRSTSTSTSGSSWESSGFVLFVVLVGLAFSRSWLLASRKRSVVFTWPAVVLAALITGVARRERLRHGVGLDDLRHLLRQCLAEPQLAHGLPPSAGAGAAVGQCRSRANPLVKFGTRLTEVLRPPDVEP